MLVAACVVAAIERRELVGGHAAKGCIAGSTPTRSVGGARLATQALSPVRASCSGGAAIHTLARPPWTPNRSATRPDCYLDRGGNRQINTAIHRVAIIRARCHPETNAYLQRKRAEGKTNREALRCLKRHLARRSWHLLQPPPPAPSTSISGHRSGESSSAVIGATVAEGAALSCADRSSPSRTPEPGLVVSVGGLWCSDGLTERRALSRKRPGFRTPGPRRGRSGARPRARVYEVVLPEASTRKGHVTCRVANRQDARVRVVLPSPPRLVPGMSDDARAVAPRSGRIDQGAACTLKCV